VSLASAIVSVVNAQLPAPQILIGTVESANGAQVLVSGIADQPVACDWSSVFEAEMAGTPTVLGRKVEVHMVDGQPIVAYTITIGEKA
jgi:hypothetical protein